MNEQQAISVLGLSSNYTKEDIKKRYRILAMKYHPDKPSGDKTKFELVTAARDYLDSGKNNTVEFTFNNAKYTATVEEFERLKKMSDDLRERLEAIRYKDNVMFCNALSILSMVGLFTAVNNFFLWNFFHIFFEDYVLRTVIKGVIWYLELSVFPSAVSAIGKYSFGERIYRKYNNIKYFKR